MREEILRKLRQVTEEEKKLLAGGSVDRTLYCSSDNFIIDSDKLLANGQLIALRAHTRFASFPMHSHNYVEIVYMCSGQTIHHIEGNPPLTLRTGELLFLNQNAVHSVEQAGREDVGVNFIVLPQFFDYALALIGTDNILGKFLLGSLRQNGRAGITCIFWFRCASRAESGGKPGVEPRASATQWPEDRPDDDGPFDDAAAQLYAESSGNFGNSLVLAALREIEENYRAADLSRLARELHVSLPALSAGVHQATGHTFKALLLEKRLSKAAQLLRETKLSTQDIIFAVGYENTSYFYRAFRARFGLTPKEYRAQCGGVFLP